VAAAVDVDGFLVGLAMVLLGVLSEPSSPWSPILFTSKVGPAGVAARIS